MKIHIFLVLVVTFFTINTSAQTITNFTTAQGLPDNTVLCIAADSQDNIWFGTQSGIAKYSGTNWTYFDVTSDPELPNNNILAIAADGDDNIWIGTDFGVSFYDGTSWTTYTTDDGLGHNRINYITIASNGDVWFSDFNGATMYNGSDFTAYGPSEGLPFGGIKQIKEGENNELWFAAGLGGLIKYDGTDFTFYTEDQGLLNNITRTVLIDDNNNKWVGTSDGISVFDDNNEWNQNYTDIFTLPPPDTLNPVTDLKMDSQGNLWVGVYIDYLVTEGGISMYNGVEWTDIDISDGLIGPVVNKLVIDSDDNVWVATSTGVSKISSITSNIDNENTDLQAVVFPNPAFNTLTIKVNSTSKDQESFIEIYNSLSQLIERIPFNSTIQKSITLPVEHLENGNYIVKYGEFSSPFVINR